MTIDPRILETARAELTERQFAIWKHHTRGMSQRAIAHWLGISRTTVSDHLDAAWRTLRKHGIMVTPDGRPYLHEQEPA